MILDDKIIDVLVDRLVRRIEQGNVYILEKIGESIKHIGTLSPSKAQQLINVLKYGGNYDKILKKLAQITELNVKDIEKIFESVAKENQYFAKQFYDYRDIKFIPYEQNISLQNQVKAIAKITMDRYVNMSNTLAFSELVNGKIVYTDLAKKYQQLIDEAVLNVSQGKTDFNSNMYKTIKDLGKSGIRTVDYANGYSKRLDSAVRMNLKGALRDMSNELQKQFGEEFDYDGIEVSHHENSAPDHIDTIDGKQFSKEEFEKINSELDRPVGQLNCYHYIFPIILGVSKPSYTKEQLENDKKKNLEGCVIDGKKYTLYEVTQLQRRLETEIRKNKDVQILAKASGIKELVRESQQKITELTNKYREVSKISGLPTRLERARVIGYKRINVNKM